MKHTPGSLKSLLRQIKRRNSKLQTKLSRQAKLAGQIQNALTVEGVLRGKLDTFNLTDPKYNVDPIQKDDGDEFGRW